jgi:polyisoprenoid-binding protein YceI
MLKTALTTAAFACLAIALAAFSPDPPAPLAPEASVAQYTIDKAHSSVSFRIRHLGISNVSGTFSDYDATIEMAGDDLASFRATASIQVGSIDTANQRRDNHLRSDDFFDAERFPAMTFESTGVRNVNGDRFEIEGNLTIRDVTRPVVLTAERLGSAVGPDGSHRVGIEARTTVDRHDFGLNWNRMTEAGGVVVGRDVTIMLDIQAIRVEA